MGSFRRSTARAGRWAVRFEPALAIYTLFWAFSFFLVLPFRLRSHDGDDVRVRGQAESAPPHFSLARTAKWTTIVSAVLFGIFYADYVYQWVPVQSLTPIPDSVIQGQKAAPPSS